MAVKQKSELMETLKTLLQDNTSDEALSLVEDFSDTFDELHNKANGDGTDWKKEYEKNDAEWRQRYKDRFFSSPSDGDDGVQTPPPAANNPFEPEDNETQKPYKFEDLFKSPNGEE